MSPFGAIREDRLYPVSLPPVNPYSSQSRTGQFSGAVPVASISAVRSNPYASREYRIFVVNPFSESPQAVSQPLSMPPSFPPRADDMYDA
jgi:hypothetical protein